MAVNQLLKNIISAIKFSENLKQVEIAEKIGVKNTYLSDVINGRAPLSELFTDKLVTAFSVNKEYLNTGEGEMFLGETKKNESKEIVSMSREVFDQITRLTETVLSQQRTIESMQEERKKMLARMDNVVISAVAEK